MGSLANSRFVNIDALRGLAAFAVVLFHMVGSGTVFANFLSGETISLKNLVYFIPAYGYIGVYLFFVISGFCIHLRWAKSFVKGIENPKIDFLSFWKRRWLRLYPAYIAAIILFLIWQYHQGLLIFNDFFLWDMVSHLLMIHNLDTRTVYSMNGVFWTLAIEEQLYLIYFLLLWLRQKYGWSKTLIVCFAARFVWLAFILIFNKFSNVQIPFTEGALANWWIWALGSLAVENYLGIVRLPKWCYSLGLSGFILLCAAILHYFGMTTEPSSMFMRTMWLFEPVLWGGGFFILINQIMQYEGKKPKVEAINYFISTWAIIGMFSYSLYLTHELILQMFSSLPKLVLIFMTMIFAYMFFLILEKPFVKYLAKQKV